MRRCTTKNRNMTSRLELEVVGRRDLLLGATGAAAFLALVARGRAAFAQASAPSADLVLKRIYGDAKPVEGKIEFELPEVAENGNTVPYSVAVDSPMTDTDYVKALYVVSTANPSPDIASFTFAPISGKARIASRMRLAKTQDVIVVAAMSNGAFYMAKREVKVTIGGCGS